MIASNADLRGGYDRLWPKVINEAGAVITYDRRHKPGGSL